LLQGQTPILTAGFCFTISVCSSDFNGLAIAQEEYTRHKNVT
jgi:hypothetical protein